MRRSRHPPKLVAADEDDAVVSRIQRQPIAAPERLAELLACEADGLDARRSVAHEKARGRERAAAARRRRRRRRCRSRR
jgi:hypothetical protein